MLVAVDVDGVMADIYPAWVALNNRLYPDGAPYQVKDVYSTRAMQDSSFLGLLSMESLYDTVLPVEGALVGIETIISAGHRVVYATSCVQGMTDPKWRWLQRHNLLPPGKLQTGNLVVTHDKSLVRADMLIDDHPKNLATFTGERILLTQPYNLEADGQFHRANDWFDVLSYMERFHN